MLNFYIYTTYILAGGRGNITILCILRFIKCCDNGVWLSVTDVLFFKFLGHKENLGLFIQSTMISLKCYMQNHFID